MRSALVRGALALAVCVAALAPWWVRNWQVLGAFVPLSTDGGGALYEGNSPNATGGPAVPETVRARLRGLEGLDELERDRLLAGEARSWIRANPGRFVQLAAVKFARTWSPVPNEPRHRRWYQLAASAADWAAVLLLAGAGLCLAGREARARALWCLVPVAAVVLGHVLVIGSVRYRLPAWPFLEVLAGAGLAALLRLRGARAGAAPPPADGPGDGRSCAPPPPG
jgi:hypothetical protein